MADEIIRVSVTDNTGDITVLEEAKRYADEKLNEAKRYVDLVSVEHDFVPIDEKNVIWKETETGKVLSINENFNVESIDVERINIGDASEASGKNSISIGYNSKTNGDNSVSIGPSNENNSNDTTLIGKANISKKSKVSNFAFGFNNSLDSSYSMTIGFGNKSNKGNYGIAIGKDNTLLSDEAIVIGSNSTAIGKGSLAIGEGTIVKADNDISIGGGVINDSFGKDIFYMRAKPVDGENSSIDGSAAWFRNHIFQDSQPQLFKETLTTNVYSTFNATNNFVYLERSPYPLLVKLSDGTIAECPRYSCDIFIPTAFLSTYWRAIAKPMIPEISADGKTIVGYSPDIPNYLSLVDEQSSYDELLTTATYSWHARAWDALAAGYYKGYGVIIARCNANNVTRFNYRLRCEFADYRPVHGLL